MATNNLQIKISAKNKTARAFRAVKAGLGGIASAAFSMRTAIGLAAGVAGLGYLVKKSMNATDEMAKMSRAVGVSVETLQRYHHAANLGGLTTKQLDKAVQKFAINIQEVSTGVGEAKDAFEQYGIAATNADGTLRAVEFVMDDVADAMAGITNKTELAAFAYDMFGGRGAAMVNVLKDGKEALRASMREADKFGLVMGTSTVKGVEDANDAITRLTSYLGAVFNRVVATLAPTIQSATDALREFVEMKINKAGGIAEFSKNIAINVLDATKAIISGFSLVINSVISLSNHLNGVANIWAKVFGDQRMTQDVKNEIDSIDNAIVAAIKSVGKWYGVRREGSKEAILDYRLQQAALQELIDTGQTFTPIKAISLVDLGESEKSIDKLLLKLNTVTLGDTTIKAATVSRADTEIAAEKDKMAEIYRLNYGLYSHLDGLEKKSIESKAASYEKILRMNYGLYGHLRDLENKTVADQAAHQSKMLDLTHSYLKKQSAIYKANQDALKNTSTTITEDIITAYKSTTDSIENTLTDAMMGTKSWGESMKDIFRQVAREYVLTNMARPLVKSITGALPTFDGGGFTGGGSRSGGVDGKGGFNAVLHPNETVIDHTKQNGNGNSSTNINFTIQANDARGFDQLLQERRGQIVGMINQAMNENGQRAIA